MLKDNQTSFDGACADCFSQDPPDRRLFLKTAALGAAGLALQAGPKNKVTSETLVTALYKTLTPAQKKELLQALKRVELLRRRRELLLGRTGDEYLADPPLLPASPVKELNAS